MSDPNGTQASSTVSTLLPIMSIVLQAILSFIPGISAAAISQITTLLANIFNNWETIRSDWNSLKPILDQIDQIFTSGPLPDDAFDKVLSDMDAHLANVAKQIASDGV